MNIPPDAAIRVPHEDLRAFVAEAACAAGLPDDRADQLADLLTLNDLRGARCRSPRTPG